MSVQNFVAKNVALPTLLRFAKCSPWPWYKELIDNDRADAVTLQKNQWEKTKSIIEYAMTNVPYYTESFSNAGFDIKDLVSPGDLLKLPTISKQQISANFPDRMTSELTDKTTWQYFATSGTTNRLMVIKDDEAISRNIALSHYEEFIQGTHGTGNLLVSIPPDACSLACGLRVQPPKKLLDRLKKSLNAFSEIQLKDLSRMLVGKFLRKIIYPLEELPSFGTAGTRMDKETLDWYINELNNLRPVVLSGLPTYLQILARHIRDTGITPPKVESILPQGGLTTPKMKKEISEIFNAPVHEVYGGHEFGCVASTCNTLEKMHVLNTECFVEVVRGGEHVPNGELGEIIITIFSNKAMPLIRYRPGDVGRIYAPDCTCGRKSPLLAIEGRIQDTIVTREGIFSAKDIIDFYATFDNVQFAQLIQKTETRCDLLIVEYDKGKTDTNRLIDASNQFFSNELRIRPRIVSTIKPEVSGKFRFVKSTSFEKFHHRS